MEVGWVDWVPTIKNKIHPLNINTLNTSNFLYKNFRIHVPDINPINDDKIIRILLIGVLLLGKDKI